MRTYVITALLLGGLFQSLNFAATPARKATSTAAKKSTKKKVVKYREPIVDPTLGDNVDGDDLTVRRAAVDALGTVNGSVVVVEPNSGRILTMVNQKLALASGFTPCSTIKLVTSLAALTEHVVSPDVFLHISRYASFNLTTAIAHSNNQYFGILGNRLGFERVTHYAQMMGLGEKAGRNIEGEQSGQIPLEPPKWGGVGLMTSFGEGFLVTPLELAALLSSIANGGTLYYLQYPRNGREIEAFKPEVKRKLDLAPDAISDIKVGMRGAVDYGTARRAGYDSSEPILGKTGTCTDFRASHHMGWFGSFNDVGHHQLVVVVMLAGGTKAVSGPVAAGVAGAIYRNLSEQRYFASGGSGKQPGIPEILTTYPCCSRQ
jgi:cell division protein FtsI/penicillin-binding protein 2